MSPIIERKPSMRGDIGMKEFGISIRGRVKNFNLPKSQPMIPLFEAIVNSFNAIDERMSKETTFKNGYISILLEREQQMSLEATDPLAEIVGMTITDNGIGFNEDNFTSFMQSDSTYKESIGGKGVGRFSWLVAFQKAVIESTYLDGDSGYVTRSFDFDMSKNEINDILVDATKKENNTRVKLDGFLSPYREVMPKQVSTIAMRIIHHCLIYFMSDNCPQVILSDGADTVNLNQLFKEKIKTDSNTDTFTVEGQKFELLHVKAEDPSLNGNRLFLCAHSRLVERKDLDKYITDLDRSIYEKHEFWYIGVLKSTYLDENVDMNRLSFNIPDGGIAKTLIGVLSMDQILDCAVQCIEEYLKDYLEPITAAKIKEINDFVTYRAPQFRHLIKHMPTEIAHIKPNLSEDKLGDELYKIKRKFDKSMQEENQKLLDTLKEGVISNAEYQALFTKQVAKLIEANGAVLAEYVAHRKVVIELLQAALNRNDDGKYNKECYIHDLIYPMRTTADAEPYDRHNLWLLDEKLTYCSYISSDIPFDNSPKENRTDIMMLDCPVAVSENENDGTEYDTIVIFELKRPMRDDYTDGENPILQLYNYVDKLRTNNVKDRNGRIIHVGANTKFYLYAVCDITPKLESVISHGGIFKRTPDKTGYYGYNDGYNAYVEVLPFDKIINDSKKRNRVLFEKLGL